MHAITEIEVDGTTIDLTSTTESPVLDADGDSVAEKCPSCGEWFARADWENEGMYGDLTSVPLCEPCYEDDTTYPSTLHRFIPGEDKSEHEYALFGNHKAYGCTEDGIDEAPGWFTDLIPEGWTGRPYVHTDGWRGYFDSDSVLVGLTKVENGWMTGDYGDVPWKRDTHAFLEALSEGEIEPPCEVFVLFEPTSNVFSTATTILAKDADAEALTEWLKTSGYDLHRALG